MASKDLHSHDHCSFQGAGMAACQNTKGYAHERLTVDQRGVSEFPSQCSFVEEEGRVQLQS